MNNRSASTRRASEWMASCKGAPKRSVRSNPPRTLRGPTCDTTAIAPVAHRYIYICEYNMYKYIEVCAATHLALYAELHWTPQL